MKNRRVAHRPLLLEELEGRLVPSASSLGYSTNWSGYAVTAGPGSVTAVVGSWTVPTILPGRGTAYSAEWVGIDGFSSATVEQIGTEADLINGVAAVLRLVRDVPATVYDDSLNDSRRGRDFGGSHAYHRQQFRADDHRQHHHLHNHAKSW